MAVLALMLLASMQCGSSVLFCELMVEVGASCRFTLSHFCVLGPYPLVAFGSCLCPWLTAGDAAVLRRRHTPSRVLEEDPVVQRATTWSVFAACSGLCVPWVASRAQWARIRKAFCPPCSRLLRLVGGFRLARLKGSRPSLEPLLRLLEQ